MRVFAEQRWSNGHEIWGGVEVEDGAMVRPSLQHFYYDYVTLLQSSAQGESSDEKICPVADESQKMHQSHSAVQVSIQSRCSSDVKLTPKQGE